MNNKIMKTLNQFVTIFSEGDSQKLLLNCDQGLFNTKLGQCVRYIYDTNHIMNNIDSLIKITDKFDEIEDKLKIGDKYEWYGETITIDNINLMYYKKEMLVDEIQFMKTKLEEISSLVELFRLRAGVVRTKKLEGYEQKRDNLVSKIILTRSKLLFYKVHLEKYANVHKLHLDIDILHDCGIVINDTIDDESLSDLQDERLIKKELQVLYDRNDGNLLSNNTVQNEVMAMELLIPGFFGELDYQKDTNQKK